MKMAFFAGLVVALAVASGFANAQTADQAADQTATTERAEAQLRQPARATTKMVQGKYLRSAAISVVAGDERRKTASALDITFLR